MEMPFIPPEVIGKFRKFNETGDRIALENWLIAADNRGTYFVLKLSEALYGLKQAAEEWH